MSVYTNIADPVVEIHHLQFREHWVTKKWELAFDTLDGVPSSEQVLQVAELAAERDALSLAIAQLSARP